MCCLFIFILEETETWHSAACHQIYGCMENGEYYAMSYVCMTGFKNDQTKQEVAT